MSEQSDDDKQFEPTQKKLDDARKKGEVPRSTDLTTAAAYGGFLAVAMALGASILGQLGTTLQDLISRSPELATEVFAGGIQPVFAGLLRDVSSSVAAWFAIPMMSVLAMIVVQKTFVVSPSKLQPKLNRISLISNAKNKFGRKGLFEFVKSLVKLVVFSAILGVFLINLSAEIVTSAMLGPAQIVAILGQISMSFIAIILLVTTVIGVVDFSWQKAEHIRKNRMSRKEMVDEAKQMEGDPFIKQKRRQKAQEIATNQMLSDVPGADVVIVNPEHYAIALKWSRAQGSAPICVAKGKGEIAARIRELANENAIPIHRDPPTARALFALVDLGAPIQPEHFKAVAAAIRFAEEMRIRMKGKKGDTWLKN